MAVHFLHCQLYLPGILTRLNFAFLLSINIKQPLPRAFSPAHKSLCVPYKPFFRNGFQMLPSSAFIDFSRKFSLYYLICTLQFVQLDNFSSLIAK